MNNDPHDAIQRIVDSARALGVEMDEAEAIQWLTAITAVDHSVLAPDVDEESGIFAHRVVLLDFDPADLERLRRVAAIVEIEDRPGVETAIALSGSSAQSQVQTFPGDFDYFERVNIQAESKEEACAILAEVVRDKALASYAGPGYQLIEVRFGTYHDELIVGGEVQHPGGSISWAPAQVEDGGFVALTASGDPVMVDWAYASRDSGWVKFDWVLVDPAEPRAVKASNMLDVTWEDPEGAIVPLDGFIDPYYQEVYLDAESIPIFCKISAQMAPDALQHYVSQLEGEVRHYSCGDHANFGKAAKRMYNIFRLTGQFAEAAYIRELFDEPAALLYQVGALLDALVEIGSDPDTIERMILVTQTDELIRDVTLAAEGPLETDLVMALLRLRDDITGLNELGGAGWVTALREMQGNINVLVNATFEARLRAIPTVDAYLNGLEC